MLIKDLFNTSAGVLKMKKSPGLINAIYPALSLGSYTNKWCLPATVAIKQSQRTYSAKYVGQAYCYYEGYCSQPLLEIHNLDCCKKHHDDSTLIKDLNIPGGIRKMKMSPSITSTIHPISKLSPYQNGWCIKARVTSKQAPRTYYSQRGEGRIFSVVFTDKSGEIKCTGFNSAADKFADLLQLNKVYLVSNCSIKPANKKFNHQHADYEMVFLDNSLVQLCDDDVALPKAVFRFIPISKLGEMSIDLKVDVIGIVKHVSDVQTIFTRTTKKELKKRDVTLADQTGTSVILTLWGSEALDFDYTGNSVVAVKGARLSEFMGGKSLSVLLNSTLLIDPDIDEAHKLRNWWLSGGSHQEQISMSNTGTAGTGTSSNWGFMKDPYFDGAHKNRGWWPPGGSFQE